MYKFKPTWFRPKTFRWKYRTDTHHAPLSEQEYVQPGGLASLMAVVFGIHVVVVKTVALLGLSPYVHYVCIYIYVYIYICYLKALWGWPHTQCAKLQPPSVNHLSPKPEIEVTSTFSMSSDMLVCLVCLT